MLGAEAAQSKRGDGRQAARCARRASEPKMADVAVGLVDIHESDGVSAGPSLVKCCPESGPDVLCLFADQMATHPAALPSTERGGLRARTGRQVAVAWRGKRTITGSSFCAFRTFARSCFRLEKDGGLATRK